MKYPEISATTKTYWKQNNLEDLEKIQSFSEMFSIAQDILSRMPERLGQVCGPITTGGYGSKEENLKFLSKSINNLQDQGIDIFDQMPFEETVHRLFEDGALQQTHADILNNFYLPLFSSGKITTLYFVQGWESSKGACWEHDKAKELGLSIVYL